MKKVGLFILLAWAHFHLVVMVCFPNGVSFLGERLPDVFQQYSTLVGLNNTWRFFAPEPPLPSYIEYEIIDDSGQTFKEGLFPETGRGHVLLPSKRRFSNLSMFFMVDPEITKAYLGRYLCQSTPHSKRVRFFFWVEEITSPEKFEITRKVEFNKQMTQRFVYFCESETRDREGWDEARL